MELDLGFDGYSPSLQCSKYIRDLLWTTEHHGSRDWYKWLAEMHSIHILTLLGQKPLKSVTKQTCSPARIRNSPTGCCTSAVDKCILYHDAITLCIISWRIALFNTFPTLWTQPFRYTVLNVISIESVKIRDFILKMLKKIISSTILCQDLSIFIWNSQILRRLQSCLTKNVDQICSSASFSCLNF